MTEKMEPVGYAAKDDPTLSKGVGLLLLWPSAHHVESIPLYTADQVKELTDRLEVAEYKLEQAVNVTGLMLQRRAERAEAALAEARKVIEPFSVMAGELFARNFNDPENVIVFQAADKTHVKLTFKDFRAARAWADDNKGEA